MDFRAVRACLAPDTLAMGGRALPPQAVDLPFPHEHSGVMVLRLDIVALAG